MLEHEVPAGVAPTRADRYLARLLPQRKPWELREAFERRDVKINGGRVRPEVRVQAGDQITVYLPETKMVLDIVFEDALVLLINKPQGVSVTPDAYGGATLTELASAYAGQGVFPCHRLDHHTGGLLLFAKTQAAHECALDAFKHHRVQKRYVCLVRGAPTPPAAQLDAYLLKNARAARVTILDRPAKGALPIRTRYETLRAGSVSLLTVEPITGRTHQIRAQMAAINHPILGDDRYGDHAFNRTHHTRTQQLWATELRLNAGGILSHLEGRLFQTQAPFARE